MSVNALERMVTKAADLQYRFFDRIRHPDAFTAARNPAAGGDFAVMSGHYVCLLVTYKRSGEPVPSPVLYALDGGKVYVRSESRSAKLRRVRHNPKVLVGPCSYRGRPLAPLVSASARELDGSAAARAHDVLFANYRWFDRIYETIADRMPADIAYLELTPTRQGDEAPDPR